MDDLAKISAELREIRELQRQWLVEQLKRRGHGSRSELAKHLGVRSDAITRMTNLDANKEAREISFEELMGIGSFFGSPPPGLENSPLNFIRGNRQNLVARQKDATVMSGSEQITAQDLTVQRASLIGESRDLPVFGVAQGGKGAMVLTSEPVDWISRPVSLSRVRDGYGIIITGDSMSPAVEAGSTSLVNPNLPPRPNDICVFRGIAADATVLVCIKRLVRESADLWHVMQHNPKKTFTLKKSDWQTCHVTVANFYR